MEFGSVSPGLACLGLNGRGFGEKNNPRGLGNKAVDARTHPLEISAAMPLLSDNTLPIAIVLYLKSLLSEEKFIDLPLSPPLRPYPTVKGS